MSAFIPFRSFSSKPPIETLIPHQFDSKKAGELFVEADGKRLFAPLRVEKSLPGLVLGSGLPLRKVSAPFFLVNATTCVTHYDAQYGVERTKWYKDDEGNWRTKTHTDWYGIHGTVGPFKYTPDTNDMQIYAGFQWPPSHVEEAVSGHLLTLKLKPYDPKDIDSDTEIDPFLKRISLAQDAAVQRIQSSLEYEIRQDIESRTGSSTISGISFNRSIKTLSLHPSLLPVYALQYPQTPARFMAAISTNPKVTGPAPLSGSKVVIVGTVVAGVASLFFPTTVAARLAMMAAGAISSGLWSRFRLEAGYAWHTSRIEKNRKANDAVLETEFDRLLREATTSSVGAPAEGRIVSADSVHFASLDLDCTKPLTLKEINTAFHKKINQCHPDKESGTNRQAIQVIAARNALYKAFATSPKRQYSQLTAQFASLRI